MFSRFLQQGGSRIGLLKFNSPALKYASAASSSPASNPPTPAQSKKLSRSEDLNRKPFAEKKYIDDNGNIIMETYVPVECKNWPEYFKSPERDLKNFPNPKRDLYSPSCRLLVIPDNWFTFFYEKTGVTGSYMFFFGLSVFIFSKEFLIINEDFYKIPALLGWYWILKNKIGKDIADYYTKSVDNMEKNMINYQQGHIKALENAIEANNKLKWGAEGALILCNAKKENVALQLEAEYRNRLSTAYSEVKRKLDYHVARNNAEKLFIVKNLTDYVVRNVKKSITPQLEKDYLQKCLSDLSGLAVKA